MKLLLLFSLFALALAEETYVSQKLAEVNDVPLQAAPGQQVEPTAEVTSEDKRIGKRSYGYGYGWNPWYGGVGHGWPWHGYGHGWYGGYYPVLPWYYGYGHGYIGYRGWPWYKKW